MCTVISESGIAFFIFIQGKHSKSVEATLPLSLAAYYKVCLVSDRGKRGAFSELTGSMSRAAGKKINRIITFSKRKPPLPGEPPLSSGQTDNPRSGEKT